MQSIRRRRVLCESVFGTKTISASASYRVRTIVRPPDFCFQNFICDSQSTTQLVRGSLDKYLPFRAAFAFVFLIPVDTGAAVSFYCLGIAPAVDVSSLVFHRNRRWFLASCSQT